MGLTGSLRTISLAEILQTLNRSRATGILRLTSTEGGRDVVYDQGEIIGVLNTDIRGRHTIVERLAAVGVVKQDSVMEVSQGNTSGGYHTVGRLIDQTAGLSEDQVSASLRDLMMDELFNLFTWENANFEFCEYGPDDPQTVATVDEAKQRPMHVPASTVLMESARRVDEWSRVRDRIPSEDVVIAPVMGAEQGLAEKTLDYPARAIVPLVDGLRAVEDIIEQTVATRLDVYGVLVELIDENLVIPLNIQDMVLRAEELFRREDFIRSANLFRRALALQADDPALKQRLAACLEHLGDAPEAAGCYEELAISYLNVGDSEFAIDAARKAVTVSHGEPRQHLVLIRCLIDQGQVDEAADELKALNQTYLNRGQTQEARATCQKILQLKPDDEEARRELARIFSLRGDTSDDDVVVCVECGESNARDADRCHACGADLHLTCLSCGRVVAVSDRVCIFCGVDPHVPASGARQRVIVSPDTAQIVRSDRIRRDVKRKKGTDVWRNELEEQVHTARELEETGDYEEALELWREIATTQIDNTDLIQHIRNLEALIHDNAIEEMIERGNGLRRRRRFYAAYRSYRSALMSMSDEDPRRERLEQIMQATRKSHTTTSVIYAMAFILVAVAGYLFLEPQMETARVRGQLDMAFDELMTVMEGSQAGMNARVYEQWQTRYSELEAEVDRVGGDVLEERLSILDDQLGHLRNLCANADLDAIIAMEEHGDVQAIYRALNQFADTYGDYDPANQRQLMRDTAEADLEQIEALIVARDIDTARARLRAFREQHRASFMVEEQDHLESLIDQVADELANAAEEAAEAPARLAEAQQLIASDDLEAALTILNRLETTTNEEVAAAVPPLLDELRAAREAFYETFNRSEQLMDSDWSRAQTSLSAVEDQAASWGQAEVWQARQRELATRLQEAESSFQRLMDDELTIERMQTWLERYGASPQAAEVQTRLRDAQRRAADLSERVASYRSAVAAEQWMAALTTARELAAVFGDETAAAHEVRLPLVVRSNPPGATLVVNGRPQGVTPLVHYAPTAGRPEMALRLNGYEAATFDPFPNRGEWEWNVELRREALWQVQVEATEDDVAYIYPVEGGTQFLTIIGTYLYQVSMLSGSLQRLHDVSGGRLGATRPPFPLPLRLAANHPTIQQLAGPVIVERVEGAGTVVPFMQSQIILMNQDGSVDREWRFMGEPGGTPVVYYSLILGRVRMAYVGGRHLYITNVLQDQTMTTEPIGRDLQAGPLPLDFGGGILLLVADVRGTLRAFADEAPHGEAWSEPLQATDVGRLVPVEGGVVTVLDGSRLVCNNISEHGSNRRWLLQLNGAVRGEPAILNDIVYLAVDQQIIRQGLRGQVLAPIPLGTPTTAGVQVAEAEDGALLMAVAVESGIPEEPGLLRILRDGDTLWQRRVPGRITTLAIITNRVIVGLDNGVLMAFQL